MTEARLKARVMIQSAVRRASMRGVAATIAHRGDPDAGLIYVKVNQGPDRGCTVLVPTRDWDTGALGWRVASGEHPVPEAEADALIERERAIDPDLWVLEIEDREGWHPFDVVS